MNKELKYSKEFENKEVQSAEVPECLRSGIVSCREARETEIV